MDNRRISETDLILNSDRSMYHLHLIPGDVADTIITVGDPDRVRDVSKYFDSIEIKKQKREFITHTGYIGKKRLTVISTGIGTANIDIVLNELDALFNIDLEPRLPKSSLKSLDVIRIGTSGAIQPEIPVDSMLISSAAFGMDALMSYYKQTPNIECIELLSAFVSAFPVEYKFNPYLAVANQQLLDKYGKGLDQAVTLTVPGFYAAQGRLLRVDHQVPDLMHIIQNFKNNGTKIANLEMETAGIYGLAACLGHRAISFNVILANRATNQFSKNPAKIMDNNIQKILSIVCEE